MKTTKLQRAAKKLLDALEEASKNGWRLYEECRAEDCLVCPPRLELKRRVEKAMAVLALEIVALEVK